jgi:glutathione synthase/RimK-type ligase-like ATP-grasp enzyme
MMEIAFVTYQQAPEMNEHDRLVADILGKRGVAVSSCVWDSPEIDWDRFDCVIIRSAWDYYLKPDQYAKWLRSFCDSSGRLWNPPRAVLQNMNKQYLMDLAAGGVNAVPTTYLPAGAGVELPDLLKHCGSENSVVKPAISGCAHGTWRTSLATAAADRHKFAEQLRCQDLLLQPYMSEVASQGEWSLVYFDGCYSHAVLKRPAPGDFRVQREFGGESDPAKPSPRLVLEAQAVLAAVNCSLLYARVDGIERAGRFMLMELEINEPFLFLGFCAGAAERFAEAIMRRLADDR